MPRSDNKRVWLYAFVELAFILLVIVMAQATVMGKNKNYQTELDLVEANAPRHKPTGTGKNVHWIVEVLAKGPTGDNENNIFRLREEQKQSAVFLSSEELLHRVDELTANFNMLSIEVQAEQHSSSQSSLGTYSALATKCKPPACQLTLGLIPDENRSKP